MSARTGIMTFARLHNALPLRGAARSRAFVAISFSSANKAAFSSAGQVLM